jgi:hypothetical protein
MNLQRSKLCMVPSSLAKGLSQPSNWEVGPWIDSQLNTFG